jgi:hypothetical protein
MNFHDDQRSMPATATRNLFLWVSGFGIGALIVLFGFLFLVGISTLGHETTSGLGPVTPAGQSAADQPTVPSPAPNPAPNKAAPAVPSTTGQAPAPANPSTPRVSTTQLQH